MQHPINRNNQHAWTWYDGTRLSRRIQFPTQRRHMKTMDDMNKPKDTVATDQTGCFLYHFSPRNLYIVVAYIRDANTTIVIPLKRGLMQQLFIFTQKSTMECANKDSNQECTYVITNAPTSSNSSYPKMPSNSNSFLHMTFELTVQSKPSILLRSN